MRQPDDWTEAEANEAQMMNRINELEVMLLFLVESDSINDSSIDEEVIELLNK
jgi:hypothetical protein